MNIRSSGVPTRLSQVGVREADLAEIVAGVKKVSFNADGVLACNPPVGAEMVRNVQDEKITIKIVKDENGSA